MNTPRSLALALVCVAAALVGCEPKPTPPKAQMQAAPAHLADAGGAARPAL